MTTVRIISGVYAHRPESESISKIIEKGGTVEVSDFEAKRLILMRIAEAVDGAVEVESAEPDEVIEVEERESLDSMTFAQLKAYAKSKGIPLGRKVTSKAAAIEAIKAAETNMDESDSPDLSMEGLIV